MNRELYVRKLALVVVLMALLVPLVLIKSKVPAALYVTGLLAIHIWVLWLYVYRVQWRQFSRRGLSARVAAVLVMAWLLSKVHYTSGAALLWSVAAAFVLHVLILTVLMVKVEHSPRRVDAEA